MSDAPRRDARFRGFLEPPPDAVVIADLQGAITDVNGAAEVMFGLSRTDLAGRSVHELVAGRCRTESTSLDAGYFASELPLFGLRRDGSEVPIEVHLRPLETDDGPRVALTVADITERIKLEATFEALYRDVEQAKRESDEVLRSLLVDLRVLVVEDEEDARELVVELLRRARVDAVGVPSSAAALVELAARSPDVILSDISMPVEDGYTFMRKVRALPPERGGTIPAAALTAHLGPEARRRAFAAGFQLHVAKPVDPRDLLLNVALLARLGGR